MLTINIPAIELFDEATDKFINIKAQTITLEHSLISISKWETEWGKPFLSKEKKTPEEVLSYIRCMIINPPKGTDVVKAFGKKEIDDVISYIERRKTATTVTFFGKQHRAEKNITSELIYYWMFSNGISMRCETWPLDRLFALIKLFGAKNAPKQKGPNMEYERYKASLNAKRRAELNSKG